MLGRIIRCGRLRAMCVLSILPSWDFDMRDGAFFHGDASKASIVTRKKLIEQLAVLDRDIEAYGGALDANDAEEARGLGGGDDRGGGGDIAAKAAALMAKRAQAQADLDALA